MRWPPNKAWTSLQKREGYRHFEVKHYGGKGAKRWIELFSVLQKEFSIIVSIAELKDKNVWESGWCQLPEDESCHSRKNDNINFSVGN